MWNPPVAARPAALALFIACALAPAAAAQRSLLLDDRHDMLPEPIVGSYVARGGDFDGDGDVDIVFGGHNSGEGMPVFVYVNAGDGSFDTVEVIPYRLFMLDMVTADLDGDGVLDLYIGQGDLWDLLEGGGHVQNLLYLGDGSGGFVDATSRLPAFADLTLAVAAGDVDGDGDLDLLVGNTGGCCFLGQQNRLLINDGSGYFTDETWRLPARTDATNDIAPLDIENDGDLDALMSSDPTLLYVNDGSGVFTIVQASLGFLPTGRLSVGDFDDDGDTDLLVGRFDGPRLFLNEGPGRLVEAPFPAPAGGVGTFGSADFDGDGHVEVLGLGEQNQIWIHLGKGTFARHEELVEAKIRLSRSVVTADFDGDSDIDAFVGSDRSNHLLLNDGRGRLVEVPAPVERFQGSSPQVAGLGDLDGDLDLDSFGVSPWGPPRVLLNDGAGRFSQVAIPGLQPTWGAERLELADLDGDGRVDVLVGAWPANALFLNEGGMLMRDASDTLPPRGGPLLALGDLDDDGDVDALVGGGPNPYPPARVWKNDGSGRFSVSGGPLPSEQGGADSFALGDIDGDGDLDIAIAHYYGPPHVYANDGMGSFALSTVLSGPIAVNLSLVDIDTDGDLDIVVGGPDPAVHLNDGAGNFQADPGRLPPGYLRNLDFADLDDDGDPDLLLIVGGTGRRLLVNDGTGHFEDHSDRLPDGMGERLNLGDIDLDGDVDVLVPWGRTLYNLTRQVSWRALPGIGKPLTLEVRGPPGGVFVLVGSWGEIFRPLPPLGILRVDHGSAFFTAAGSLDAGGVREVVWPVPPHPALIGRTAAWQALVGFPRRLSNLERTKLTDL